MRHYATHFRPTQGGFVSIEMIIVLIIIAIGVGLGLAAAAGMFSSSNANEEQRNISVIAANARALKTSSGYGSSGTNLIEPDRNQRRAEEHECLLRRRLQRLRRIGHCLVHRHGLLDHHQQVAPGRLYHAGHQDREEHIRADQDQQRIRDHW